MWQQRERFPDEISLKVDLTANFSGFLHCYRTDKTDEVQEERDGDTGRERDGEWRRFRVVLIGRLGQLWD